MRLDRLTPVAGEGALTLVSHVLCPYVQRAVIALTEKGVAFQRIDVDLADKPDWFRAISPLGKTPVLCVGDAVIFESAVILEYLDETAGARLHPADPLARADNRSWMEMSSAILADIAGLYGAPDAAGFEARRAQLAARFARVEERLVAGPWFNGPDFSLVDATFGPVFRYFDAFDRIAGLAIATGLPKVARWRQALAARPSVRDAVVADYPARLEAFLRNRGGHLSRLMAGALPVHADGNAA